MRNLVIFVLLLAAVLVDHAEAASQSDRHSSWQRLFHMDDAVDKVDIIVPEIQSTTHDSMITPPTKHRTISSMGSKKHSSNVDMLLETHENENEGGSNDMLTRIMKRQKQIHAQRIHAKQQKHAERSKKDEQRARLKRQRHAAELMRASLHNQEVISSHSTQKHMAIEKDVVGKSNDEHIRVKTVHGDETLSDQHETRMSMAKKSMKLARCSSRISTLQRTTSTV